MFDSLAVETAHLVSLFKDLAVTFHKFRVKAIRDRARLVRNTLCVIELLHLTLCQVTFIEIHARILDDVVFSTSSHCVEVLVEHHRCDKIKELINRLVF